MLDQFFAMDSYKKVALSRKTLPLFLVGVLGLIITIIVFFVVREKEAQEIRSNFQFTVNRVNDDIKDILKNDISTLRLIEALFQGSEYVTRQEFKKFVQPILKRHSHILLFGWLPFVKPEEESALHKKFAKERITSGNIPSQEGSSNRRGIFPAYYLEGPAKNRLGIGTDMGNRPHVHEALIQAGQSGSLGAAKIDWPSPPDNPQVYMVFLPVFGKNYIFDIPREKTDASLAGFIFGFFPIESMLREVREKHDLSGIKINFFDADQTVENSVRQNKFSTGTKLENLESVRIGNRELMIRSQSLPGYVSQRLSWRPALTLAAGIFLVGLLLLYLEYTFRRAAQIELLAEKLSDEVSERKRVAKAREILVSELEAKNAELERFTYTVSHDLKSPLITIRGFTGLLAQDAQKGDAERVKTDAEQIKSATDKMQKLLDELLELSRVGRLFNPPRDIDLNELVDETLAMLAGQVSESGVEISVAPQLPVIHGDRPRLLEVFQNLVDNAMKFMGDEPRPRIEIYAENHTDYVSCFIRDNGIGIPDRYKQKIFGLFERLDQTCEGTGIGLALVKRIVEFHGGRIWVESNGEGKGSTFVFTLPTKQEGMAND